VIKQYVVISTKESIMLDISIFRFQKILGPDIRVLAMAILNKDLQIPYIFYISRNTNFKYSRS